MLRGRRRAVQRVRRHPSDDQVASSTERLFALCADPTLGAWIARLPKGEGAAVARLRVLHAEWQRRRREGVRDAAGLPTDFAQRVWALATEALPRVLEGGRYLTEDAPARARDHAPFKPARRRARKPAAPGAPVAQPT